MYNYCGWHLPHAWSVARKVRTPWLPIPVSVTPYLGLNHLVEARTQAPPHYVVRWMPPTHAPLPPFHVNVPSLHPSPLRYWQHEASSEWTHPCLGCRLSSSGAQSSTETRGKAALTRPTIPARGYPGVTSLPGGPRYPTFLGAARFQGCLIEMRLVKNQAKNQAI